MAAASGGQWRAPVIIKGRVTSQFAIPIIYGNHATYFGKKKKNLDDGQTHKWSVFLRAADNFDLSPILSKVVFDLHPSFEDPQRVVTQPPYIVEAVGWGEFPIEITLYFADTHEKPVHFTHMLKLNPLPGEPKMTVSRPIISEVYDEILFQNPTEKMYYALLKVYEALDKVLVYNPIFGPRILGDFVKQRDTSESALAIACAKFQKENEVLVKQRDELLASIDTLQ